MLTFDLNEGIGPGCSWHPDIQDNDVPLLLLDQLEEVKGVGAFSDRNSSQAIAQQVLQAAPKYGMIIRDQNFEHASPPQHIVDNCNPAPLTHPDIVIVTSRSCPCRASRRFPASRRWPLNAPSCRPYLRSLSSAVVPCPGQPAISSEPPMAIERSFMPRSPKEAGSLSFSA